MGLVVREVKKLAAAGRLWWKALTGAVRKADFETSVIVEVSRKGWRMVKAILRCSIVVLPTVLMMKSFCLDGGEAEIIMIF